ncbi:lysozyme [Loktanella sp. DSM 29012]|uniref:glycoside hydrolase family 25 protein n=1 Tax=Loktanella sp. DSM 29012 TaxID=1881056 RepID=UPI0008B33D57|nr:GH25 family lysozyme [Loktanella sp. DSM 29012]SEP77644.1 lysozyme [Loktanella sp. DSM 29012]
MAALRVLSLSLICSGLIACGGTGGAVLDDAPGNPRFADADPHPAIGTQPAFYPVHGLDVSRYQTDIDWRTARAAGIRFVYIKATEGGDLSDPMFAAHRNGAKAAGVRYGAYHFYYFCRSPQEQAAWFIANVPRDRNALPHVLDLEWNHGSQTCRRRPDGATVRAEAQVFMDIIERHYGRRPLVYTTPDIYRDAGLGALPRTQFWLRSVAAHPAITYSGEGWSFWQYTSTGIVPGVARPVDINAFAGSLAEWERWIE